MKYILAKRIGMNKKLLLIVDALVLIILVVADQWTKYLAVLNLKGNDSMVLIDGIFELYYLENRGAAFGVLQNQKIFFIMIAIIILAMIVYVLYKMPYHKIYIKLHVALVFIAGGAIGNLIDRLRLNYVVDFFYFKIINFPVFNVADIYVTCAAAALVIMLMFVYNESDLEFLSFRTKKFRDVK
jgi:signal peptidase II